MPLRTPYRGWDAGSPCRAPPTPSPPRLSHLTSPASPGTVHPLSTFSWLRPGTHASKNTRRLQRVAEGQGSWELGGPAPRRVSRRLPGMENFTQTPADVGSDPPQAPRPMHGAGRSDSWSPRVSPVASDDSSDGQEIYPLQGTIKPNAFDSRRHVNRIHYPPFSRQACLMSSPNEPNNVIGERK